MANPAPKIINENFSYLMSVSVSVSVSVSLAWGQGHGQALADTGPQALPDQQRSCPCLSFCDLLVSQQHISHFDCSKPWQRQA